MTFGTARKHQARQFPNANVLMIPFVYAVLKHHISERHFRVGVVDRRVGDTQRGYLHLPTGLLQRPAISSGVNDTSPLRSIALDLLNTKPKAVN